MERKDPWVGGFVTMCIVVVMVTKGCDTRTDYPADLTDNEICAGPGHVGNDC